MTSTTVWVASFLFFCYLANRLYKSRAFATKAHNLGCEEPVIREKFSRWPFGIDVIKRTIEADRGKFFPPFLQKNAERYGITWRHSILGTSIVFTVDPENVKAILATQFDDFDLGPLRRGPFWPMLGNGIFTQDGHAWKVSRDMMRPQFTRDQINDVEVEEKHVQNLMTAIDARLQNGWTEEIDLQVLFFRLTMDSATEVLLGG